MVEVEVEVGVASGLWVCLGVEDGLCAAAARCSTVVGLRVELMVWVGLGWVGLWLTLESKTACLRPRRGRGGDGGSVSLSSLMLPLRST